MTSLNCLITAGIRVLCLSNLFEIFVLQCGRFSGNALVSRVIIIAPMPCTHFKQNDSLFTKKNE